MDKDCFPYNSASRPFLSLTLSLIQHMLKAVSAGIKRHGTPFVRCRGREKISLEVAEFRGQAS